MSVFVLVTGAIWRAPETKTSPGGERYVAAVVRSNHEDITTFWSVEAFDPRAAEELLRLGFGEAVSIQGTMRAEIQKSAAGEPRLSLTLVAHAALSLRPKPRGGAPTPTGPASKTERDRIFPEWP